MRIVLASNNAKKLGELQSLFQHLPIELVTQSSLGVAEAEEPHRSFVENALAKARHAAAASRLPALADDSGLCVQVLGGLPGVDSAHIAPVRWPANIDALSREERRRLQDAANNRWLLEQLRPGMSRRAHFVCVLVALRHAQDPEPLIATGHWRGVVLEQPEGDGGFGYDPLIRMDDTTVSVASLDAAAKNRWSHRARAARAMAALMSDAWQLAP